MNATAMWFPASIAALAIAIGANTLLYRYFLPSRAVARFGLVAIAMGGVLAIGLYSEYANGIETIAGLFCYMFGCEFYVFLFTLGLASISVNIMLRLRQSSLDDGALSDDYNGTKMISLRIDRLVQKGFVSIDGEHLRVSESGRRLVYAFVWLRKLLCVTR